MHQILKEMFEIPKIKELTRFFFLPKRVYQTKFKNGLFHKFLYLQIYFNLMYFTQFHRDETERFLLKLPNNLSIRKVIEKRNFTEFDLKGMRFTSLRQPLVSTDSTELASFLLYRKRNFPMPPSTAVHVSPLMFCRQKIIGPGIEVDRNNFRIIDNNNNKTFYLGEFVVDFDRQFRVCVEEKQFSSATFDYGYVLEMFATILNVISIVSMMVLLILYMVVPGLRTLPGLNTMSTTFSLLCMQLTYMFANAVEKSSLFCTVIGILLHYFWLSLCCCLFTCSLHMCRSFSDRRGYSHIHTNIKFIFGRYVIYCYITPIFIITTNIILTYYIQNKIGYGTTLCFVEDFVQNLATFIAPLLITCVVNIVMFTITVININSVKHIEKSKKDKSELVIFLKLFSLTGIVWIFQIVDGVLNISAFSFVATLLTSSQGTIIFLSFASSSRILKYLRSKRENKGKNEITDSKQTTRKGSGTSPLDLTKSTQAQGSSITI
nr:probable G-protein coupled receptor Mth-like 3 [Crassostrea gigas]